MTSSSERIRKLAEQGALQPEQAEDLLAAVKPHTTWGAAPLLLDPLTRFGGERLSLVGAVAVLAGMGLGRLGLYFDGFLDLHLSPAPLSLLQLVVEALVVWPLGAAVLWLASLIAARQGRFIDFLGLVGVARVPMVLFALPLAAVTVFSPLPPPEPGVMPHITAPMMAAILFGLAGVAWFVTLLYRGFGTASGLKGGRRVITFVSAVLIAEIVLKWPIMLVR